MFSFAMPEKLTDLGSYARTRGTLNGVSYKSVCREVIGPIQMGQIRRLIGFYF